MWCGIIIPTIESESLMPWIDIIWTDIALEKIAAHGVDQADVERVLMEPTQETISRRSGLPLVRGFTDTGRPLVVVFRWVDAITVEPITAYEPD